MRLPDFLIIGAMKAGTTSLYHDLALNPAIYMALDKELNDLVRDEVLTEDGRQAYARHFARARPDQVCGEASTSYSKLPDIPGVPDRARRLLGPDVRVIYVVREPIARIMSQHHHEQWTGRITCGIDEAVRQYPRLIDYSRYAMQIEPWIDIFGPQRVRVIRFEDYIASRRSGVEHLSRFLGVEPESERIREDLIHNPSYGKPLPSGPIAALRHAPIYRRLVRTFLPHAMRSRLRRALLPKAHTLPQRPSPATVEFLVQELRDDVERLGRLMGLNDPPWKLPCLAETDGARPTVTEGDHPARHDASACR